jgi:hypothetical protein
MIKSEENSENTNQLFFEPIPVDMLRIISMSPIITLEKKGLFAFCLQDICEIKI